MAGVTRKTSLIARIPAIGAANFCAAADVPSKGDIG